MTKVRTLLAALGGAALLASIPAVPAGAAVTIGADLSTPATQAQSCTNPSDDPFACTWFNSTVPGRTVTSPIDGVIVRWRIHPDNGSEAQDVRLRILRPAGGSNYQSGGTSAAHAISTVQALQVFPTRLPVRTGDHIGLDQSQDLSQVPHQGLDAMVVRAPVTGAQLMIINPRLPDSGTGSANPAPGPAPDDELVLNADIEADADADTFGDETQDQCPTSASTQGPCPSGGGGGGGGDDELPLAVPVLGRLVNVFPVKGKVFVSLPPGTAVAAQVKGRRFIALEQARQVPVGSLLDTRKGTVRVVSATITAATQSGQFTAGIFQLLQSRKRSAKGLTELRLKGSNFNRCKPKRGKRAQAALSKRAIRRLRSNATGRFRTRGRYSAATVRGTKWTTTDRCDGTLTQVQRGSVTVRDFRRKRNVVVKRGKRYLAKAPG